MGESEILKIFAQYGPIGLLLLFFVWWTYKRDVELSNRWEATEDWIRETLIDVLEKNNKAFFEFTAALRKRPCMYEKENE